MHIAIDIRAAAGENPTGKGVWSRACIKELLQLLPHETISLLTDRLSENFPASMQRVFAGGWRWHIAAARFVRRQNVDVYLSPTSYIVPALLGAGVPVVPVVHDLIAFQHEPHDRKATLIERLLLRRTVRCAAHILCVSAATAQELRSRYSFVSEGDITICAAGPRKPSVALNTPDGTTILSLGTLCPRKNQLRLLEAYASLTQNVRSKSRLVLVGGRGWQDAAILEKIKATPGVEWRGYLSDDEVERLFQTCTVFAYPSLHEGFGLPLLNALQHGIPTLTSDRSSLKEVADEAALLVNPENTGAIGSALERLLTDDALRSRLRDAGPKRAAAFSWVKTAQIVADTLARGARKP